MYETLSKFDDPSLGDNRKKPLIEEVTSESSSAIAYFLLQ